MATIPILPQAFGAGLEPDYSTGDGKPLAETPIHRDNLLDGVKTLELHERRWRQHFHLRP